MPTYEYACSACRHRTDVLHGVDGTGPAVCPSCGAEGTMRKAFAAPAIVFKGSGWAKRDRRSAPTASSARKGEGSDGAGSDGPDNGGSSDGGATASGEASADDGGKAAAKAPKDPAPTGGTAAPD